MSNFNFYETNSCVDLLKDHALNEYGLWRVCGEDPNCDYAGSHHEPYLGTYEGILQDVIETVTSHDKFWQWGAGGSIEKIQIRKCDAETNRKKQLLQEEKAVLEARLKEIGDLQ